MSKQRKKRIITNDEKAIKTGGLIPQVGTSFNQVKNPISWLLAGLAIYGMIFPLVFADISVQLYQYIYFGIQGIPKIDRSKYIIVERWNLPKLTLWQRINCVYCDYGNGLAAWLKEVVAQTEIHSCAIKNDTSLLGQNHTDKYWDRSVFE